MATRSLPAAELCIGKGLVFDDLGAIELKGFEQPVRAQTVRWTS